MHRDAKTMLRAMVRLGAVVLIAGACSQPAPGGSSSGDGGEEESEGGAGGSGGSGGSGGTGGPASEAGGPEASADATGVPPTDAKADTASDAGALSGACLACVSSTCGAEYAACTGEPGCANALAAAFACLRDAKQSALDCAEAWWTAAGPAGGTAIVLWDCAVGDGGPGCVPDCGFVASSLP